MSDFTRISNHNPHANFKSVQIGADAPVLEVELNELQDIANQRYKDLLSTYYGDGLNGESTISYDSVQKEVCIENGGALVGGNPIQITRLVTHAVEGDKVYLKVWEQSVSFNDTIYYLGNVQESRIIENTLIDDRIGRETSRRIQIQYDLVTNKQEDGASYLEVGYILNGELIITSDFKSDEQRVTSELHVPKEGSSVITLNGSYLPNTNALLVFVDGFLQYPQVHYFELNNNQIRFNALFTGEQEVFIKYAKLNVARKVHDSHSDDHKEGGLDPIDINDLADRTGLFAKIKTQLQYKHIDGGNFIDDDVIEDETFDGGYF